MQLRFVIVLFGCLVQSLMVSFVNGANIMFFFGWSSYSHRVGLWPLILKLSDLGHSLTCVSPFPNKFPHPNIQDYVPLDLKKLTDERFKMNHFNRRVPGQIDKLFYKSPFIGIEVCQVLMNDPDFVNWIKSSKFDIVFVDSNWNECGYGMAYKLKAKIIVISTNIKAHLSEPFGLPDESSWIPNMINHYQQKMNIYQRFVNNLVPLFFNFLRENYYFPKLEEIMKEKLDLKEIPSLSDIERNVSLVFVNQHYPWDYARSFPPNVIPIGGLRCLQNQEKLPQDLENFIEKGSLGFVYISFGTYIEFNTFSKKTQAVFWNTVCKLRNIQFIWKLNPDEISLAEIPQNVYAAKWMPQQAILAHPKIKAFITHAGLFGIEESICHSVPLIAFPVLWDQDFNAVELESREIGIKLEITTITELELENGINKILHDQKYCQNMEQVSLNLKDNPVKPLDAAVWWTEFVLRHNDTSYLRPHSINQTWWKKRHLDILAILFVAVSILFGIVYNVIKLIKSVIFRFTKVSPAFSFIKKQRQKELKNN